MNQRKPPDRPPAVQISEADGVRFLHRGGDAIQSAMRVDDPATLDLEYTRCMMAFLLFQPHPRDVLMIGLGGGSLAKFVRRRLPRARATVVEIDPQVVRIARGYFHLPPDGPRLQVRVGDGAVHLQQHPACADVILLDGFEGGRQAPQLTSQTFYDDAFRALRRHGLLVVNFMGSDRHLKTWLNRLGQSFDGRLACLRARGEGNIVVLAFRDDPGMITRAALVARAQPLQERHGMDLCRYAASLRRPRNILKVAR
jgi:spermidine synthase